MMRERLAIGRNTQVQGKHRSWSIFRRAERKYEVYFYGGEDGWCDWATFPSLSKAFREINEVETLILEVE